jgi:nitric oxide reductase activation protein
MLGLAPRRHGRQPDGNGLDPAALVDFAVARAAGVSGDARIYRAPLRTARDLGVVVLLDASGSTHEQRGDGTTLWDRHRQLCARLVSALEVVGDRVAAYGFSSRGRHHVRFVRIKEFDGRFHQGALRRLAGLEPSGYTRLGAAVRHATHLAADRAGTGHRLVVLLSDGFPHDDDYRDRYAEHDTRRALDEAVARGVGCVCVSLGASTDQAKLDRVWGNVAHVHLERPEEFSRHVVPLFQAALRAAAPATRSGGGQHRARHAGHAAV